MTSIADIIQKNRPHLSANSIKTYSSILINLWKRKHTGEVNLSWFEDQDAVLDQLKDVPPKNRKTILASLVVFCKDKKCVKYQEQMKNDRTKTDTETKQQTMTESQKENWVNPDDIQHIFNNLQTQTKPLWKKENLSMNDFQQLQGTVILAVLGGIYIPPRRALDFCAMKIKGEINRDSDNYMHKNTLVFNQFKTSKHYGQQTVPIPPKLAYILREWIKINPTEWLLFDTKKQPLTSVKLNQRFSALFGGKKVGVNMMRHTYLTDMYKNTPALAQLDTIATEMGHSVNEALQYVKKN
jgi:hypothetical protein